MVPLGHNPTARTLSGRVEKNDVKEKVIKTHLKAYKCPITAVKQERTQNTLMTNISIQHIFFDPEDGGENRPYKSLVC